MADQHERIAVVTGAGRGLGQAIALGFAERGARVAAMARGAAGLRETEQLARDVGGSVLGFSCDVSDYSAVAALKRDVRSRLGRPSILVNAAGIFGPIDLVRDADPEQWTATVMIDAVAAFYTVNAFVGDMIDDGWGRIVNVTSAASLHPPGPINSAYGTAKAALTSSRATSPPRSLGPA